MTRHHLWISAVLTLALASLGGCKKQESTSPDEAAPTSAGDDADADDDDAEEADADEEPAAEMLTKSSFEDTVSEHFSDVSDCYVAALEGNPDLAGQLVANFTISGEGKVTALTAADGSSLNDEGLVACIAERAQGWDFPKPSGDEMSLQYPFNLAPAK